MQFKYVITLIAFLMIGAVTIQAQNEGTDKKKIIIVEKTINENGEESTQTIELEGAEADKYMMTNGHEGNGEIEVRVDGSGSGTTTVWISKDGEEEIIELDGDEDYHFIDGENADVKIFKIGDDFDDISDAMDGDVEVIIDDENHGDQRVIIKKRRMGNGTDDRTYLKDFGLENIDPADIKTININQDNGTSKIHLILKDGKEIKKVIENDEPGMGNMFFFDNSENHFIHDVEVHRPCSEDRPFLGISMRDIHKATSEEELVEKKENGVEILSVTPGSGAAAAGLNSGDIITSIDGKKILTNSDVSEIINGHNVGDVISIELNRGQQTMNFSATIGKRECRDRYAKARMGKGMQPRHEWTGRDTYFPDRNFKRDPCKPLIGFYHHPNSEDGIKIKHVIEDTPAQREDLQKGDVVLSFDGVTLTSWKQLIELRDQHEAGDRFKMTIIRDGKKQKIKANFNDCPKDQTKPEIAEYDLDDIIVDGKAIDFSVYPNPSLGIVTVEYQGDAAPLSIMISDITGRVLIDRSIEDFDGTFKQEFDFSDAAEGTLLVRIQQGEDAVVRQIVLQKGN